jgi:16S rRNA (adenine1518-N6/adenine1519-N6)-dimethyltransferase
MGLSPNELNPFSPGQLKKLFSASGIRLAKNRGQNYLIDRNTAERIIELVVRGTPLFEVGTGMGALTILLPPDSPVYTLEIDAGIHRLLSGFPLPEHIHLIHADFLKFDPAELNLTELFFLSNLPYSISGEAVKRFIEFPVFKNGLIMVQKEFMDKMTARPGMPGYGIMSVLCRTFLSVWPLFPVSRKCFFPMPSVDSFVVSLTKKEIDIHQDELKDFLSSCFGMKRKTIGNNFKKSGLPLETLVSLGIPLTARPEEISPEQWISLYRRIKT